MLPLVMVVVVMVVVYVIVVVFLLLSLLLLLLLPLPLLTLSSFSSSSSLLSLLQLIPSLFPLHWYYCCHCFPYCFHCYRQTWCIWKAGNDSERIKSNINLSKEVRGMTDWWWSRDKRWAGEDGLVNSGVHEIMNEGTAKQDKSIPEPKMRWK